MLSASERQKHVLTNPVGRDMDMCATIYGTTSESDTLLTSEFRRWRFAYSSGAMLGQSSWTANWLLRALASRSFWQCPGSANKMRKMIEPSRTSMSVMKDLNVCGG